MNITRIAQPGRLRLIIAAAIVAIAGLVIPLTFAPLMIVLGPYLMISFT